ncbi:polyamine aminopropyltransferase [Actinacidiphila acidipaludis]|uniref:Polyamine aminopropyltransferase n=1 Tax=Actinacidiphila acidipaludis TaxID=2873382 RepID=A0ABS7QH96_9ACTN|nr:polyamine aminopropyltransferase [Streptomyces acidipaludis]MBY8882181.1 polyamine aminopropyltransferase [Streptomyces acidipaludis]
MIDQHSRTRIPSRRAEHLPVPVGAARALVLAAVFVCAACGLVYELELVALASSLVGDSVTQASVVLSVMVFAMGCGSLLAKRLRARAAAAFAAVESALALVGGLSVMALYGFFAWDGQARPAMVGCAFAIGVLIGAEVPLLMTLVQRIRRQDAGGAVADLFAADYVGALVGGLAFPFLLLPRFGQLTGALATGVVNAVAGGAVVLWLFRSDLTRRERARLLLLNVLVLAVLGGAAWAAAPFERAARRAVYGADVRVAEQTPIQEVVLAGGPRARPLRLYLDGRLTLCGSDAAAYGQALAGPALGSAARRVLVLGGGDGVVAGQVLRHPGLREVTVVDADAELLRLGRTDPGLGALNGHAFDDPRVRAVAADPFDWLRGAPRAAYDVILADLPAPAESRAAKFYSEEFYGLARRVLGPGGRLAVHVEGPRTSLWTVRSTLRAVGLSSAAYVAPGHTVSCGAPWTFLLAGSADVRPFPVLPPPPSAPPPPPSTLLHPRA